MTYHDIERPTKTYIDIDDVNRQSQKRQDMTRHRTTYSDIE